MTKNSASAFPIVDAKSFYQCIKQNAVFSDDDDKEAIAALESELLRRMKVADESASRGEKRDAFLFFQGALMGMMVAYRQTAHHYKNEMRKQAKAILTDEQEH